MNTPELTVSPMCQIEDGKVTQTGGLTLRDYFAAMAIQPITLTSLDGDGSLEDFAMQCYEMADAMLKARNKKP